MKITPDLLNHALAYAGQLYLDSEEGQKRYELAIKLVKQCHILGTQAGLAKQDIHTAHLSALFLFSGKPFSPNKNDAGNFEKAGEFLKNFSVDADFLKEMEDCMAAVLPPQIPVGPAGQLLCDGLNGLLVGRRKKQTEDIGLLIPGFPTEGAKADQYRVLFSHLSQMVFFTNPAKKAYDKALQKAIDRVKNIDLNSEDNENQGVTLVKNSNVGISTEPKPDRGAATLFRNASREHIAMLSIVHQKSGFLLSFNSILLSVVLSILSTKLAEFPHLLIPTVMLIVTCLGTIIFTILATKPMIIRNRKDPLARDTFNAMFFGHYVHLDWQEYSKHIKHITKDVDDMVEVLSKNIYYQGVVLDKKYRLLSIAYKIFLFGLIISVSAFVISFFR